MFSLLSSCWPNLHPLMLSQCASFRKESSLFCFHMLRSAELSRGETLHIAPLKSQCVNFAPSTELSKTTVTVPFVKTPSLLQADILFTCCGHYWCHLPNSGLWEQLADGGLLSAITITKPPYWLALEDGRMQEAGARAPEPISPPPHMWRRFLVCNVQSYY